MTQLDTKTQSPETSTPTPEQAAPKAKTLKAPKPPVSPDAPETQVVQQPALLEPAQHSSAPAEQGNLDSQAIKAPAVVCEPKTFDQCVEKLLVMKGALARSLGTYLMGVFALADEMAATKPVYEQGTMTGQGKRNPGKNPTFVQVMGQRLDYEETTIRHYLKVAELSQQDRQALLDSGAKVDFSLLYQLALEPEPQKRATAIKTLKVKGKKKAKAELKASRPTSSKSKNLVAAEPPVDKQDEVETKDNTKQAAEPAASPPSSTPSEKSAPSTRKSSPKHGPAPDPLKGGVTVALLKTGDVVLVGEREQVIRLHVVKVTPDAIHVELTR